MTVENVPYSFVQMADPTTTAIPDCEGADFPVFSSTDVRFQFVMKAANPTELAYLTTPHLIRLYYNGASHNSTVSYNVLNLGNNEVLIYLPIGGVPEINSLPVGTCFRLVYGYATGLPTPYSSCFSKRPNTDNTTLLEYGNTVDQNGFFYCNVPGYTNKIRLPMLVNEVSFDGVDNIYRFSDGRQYNPSAYRNKILHFQTDWMPVENLDYLQAALLSRLVKVTTDLYTGEIVNTGAIEPEFNDSISDMRKTPRAAFTAYATPYYMALNSCTSCAD